MVRDLLDKQKDLRDETKQTELDEQKAEELSDTQAELQKELSQLSKTLDQFPDTDPLLEQAITSASEATLELFDSNKEEALVDQSTVIGSLAQIEEQLQNRSCGRTGR